MTASSVPSPATARPLPPLVLVLLPVYNGARYLAEQVDSILRQEDVQTLVLCRDDGSTDDSVREIQALQARWPGRFEAVNDGLGNLGASGNFSRLMHLALDYEASAPWQGPVRYVALSDQDDLWHPDKLRACMEAMRQLEHHHPGQPALVHSDLRVIADDGREIAPSMARYQGLQVGRPSLAAQALSNTLTGCTSLMNRELLELGLPVPPKPSCMTGGCRWWPARWAQGPTWTGP